MGNSFDPDLMYVECGECGNPILWEPGRTRRILEMAGIDPDGLDERCCLISEGCPMCKPEASHFATQVVRLGREKEDGAKERRQSAN
jgi:hypothetical protein